MMLKPKMSKQNATFPSSNIARSIFYASCKDEAMKVRSWNVHVTVSANQTASYEQLQYPY